MSIIYIRGLAIVLAYAIGYFTAPFFGLLYSALSPELVGGGSNLSNSFTQWLAGLPLAIIFFLSLFQATLSRENNSMWIGISAVPVLLIEFVIDPLHIYFPIILGVIAWILGTIAHKILTQLAPSFMSKIS